MKLATRTQLAATRQGAFESIISFKQHYNNALKAYNDQKNPVMKPEDIAMDFFLENLIMADMQNLKQPLSMGCR